MDILRIRHRDFEIIEIISNNAYKCSFKGKIYFVKQYNLQNSESESNFHNFIRIARSSINTARLRWVDKKQGYVVTDYIEGVTVFDYISDHDFNEIIYREIFLNSYMAKVSRMALDYSLKSWLIVGNELFYISDYLDFYTPEKDFTKTDLRLWFMSKDLANYYEKNGILFDKSRLKQEYEVNKEMVLMTCKYYQ